MPRRPFLRLVLASSLIATAGAGPAHAQQSTADGGSGGVLGGANAAAASRARASRVPRAPVIDGDVLGDPAYEDASVATGFSQNRPDEGRPASDRTEVRIVYTDDTLYFGVVCYTRDAGTIIVADSRRDSQLNETDSFQIILDTFLDQQNGFVFGTNPAGIEYDGQVSNEGQGSGRMGGGGSGGGSQQQRGSGGGFNLNWDGAWQVEAQVTEIGWTAEFAIPFRTLRYPGGSSQTWGVNFQRNIRHRNERSFWAPLPRQFNLNRLSLAGLLQGLEVPSQGNLKLTPYVLGEAVRSAARPETISTGNFGADLKYSVTPGMTLDLTYNTDFAQVEVDDQQINLDRFNLFFPEKRPFFLENAGLFSVGRPGTDRGLLQPPHRHWRGGPAGAHRRRRPPVGQGRRQHERRLPEHADRRAGRQRGGSELHGGPRPPGPAQPLEHRRHRGQPAGSRQSGGRLGSQPHLRGGRTVRPRPVADRQRLLRRYRDPREYQVGHGDARGVHVERFRDRERAARACAMPRSARTSIPRSGSTSGGATGGRKPPCSPSSGPTTSWASTSCART